MKTEGWCVISRCRHEGTLKFLGRWICSYHWDMYAPMGRKVLIKKLKVDEEADHHV